MSEKPRAINLRLVGGGVLNVFEVPNATSVETTGSVLGVDYWGGRVGANVTVLLVGTDELAAVASPAGHKKPQRSEPGNELRAAAAALRTRCRMERRYADPLAALLDLIAERHPMRRMRAWNDDDPPEYCGACQDPPVQKRQWPCPEVIQALELARALNGREAG